MSTDDADQRQVLQISTPLRFHHRKYFYDILLVHEQESRKAQSQRRGGKGEGMCEMWAQS